MKNKHETWLKTNCRTLIVQYGQTSSFQFSLIPFSPLLSVWNHLRAVTKILNAEIFTLKLLYKKGRGGGRRVKIKILWYLTWLLTYSHITITRIMPTYGSHPLLACVIQAKNAAWENIILRNYKHGPANFQIKQDDKSNKRNIYIFVLTYLSWSAVPGHRYPVTD